MFSNKSDNNNWLSLADMMTALMVIFMFIAINYIMQVIEHTFVRDDIYTKLELELKEEIESEYIHLAKDGTVRFNIDKGKKLFDTGSATPTWTFKKMLSEILPKYWAVLKSDSTYFDYIKEIRIEGHSDIIGYNDVTPEQNYLKNLALSQQRAANVLKYLRRQPLYRDASDEEKARMDFLFTSIGFSFSRTINKEGKYVYTDSNKVIDNKLSRRVEFRIVTSSDKLAREINDENEE